jgi:uncharacterized protein
VIVFDVSALVGAAIRRDGVPELAMRRALREDRIAVSKAVMAELLDVLARPRLARFLDSSLRAEVLSKLNTFGVFFEPEMPVTDCRDAKDNKYLELALASGAGAIVSSDADLLVLDPWRGLRTMRPADYLAEAGGKGV